MTDLEVPTGQPWDCPLCKERHEKPITVEKPGLYWALVPGQEWIVVLVTPGGDVLTIGDARAFRLAPCTTMVEAVHP